MTEQTANRDIIKSDVSSLTQAVSDMAGHIKSGSINGLAQMADSVADEAVRHVDQVSGYVRKRPFAAVLAALGVGLLASRILIGSKHAERPARAPRR